MTHAHLDAAFLAASPHVGWQGGDLEGIEANRMTQDFLWFDDEDMFGGSEQWCYAKHQNEALLTRVREVTYRGLSPDEQKAARQLAFSMLREKTRDQLFEVQEAERLFRIERRFDDHAVQFKVPKCRQILIAAVAMIAGDLTENLVNELASAAAQAHSRKPKTAFRSTVISQQNKGGRPSPWWTPERKAELLECYDEAVNDGRSYSEAFYIWAGRCGGTPENSNDGLYVDIEGIRFTFEAIRQKIMELKGARDHQSGKSKEDAWIDDLISDGHLKQKMSV